MMYIFLARLEHHYLTLQMLEGFVPRDQIRVVHSGGGVGKVQRFRSMITGETDACSVTEPWNTVADRWDAEQSSRGSIMERISSLKRLIWRPM